jgi:2'-5' RNA ligase
MRIFVALDLDNAIRQGIAAFIDQVRGFAPEARWVAPESLHVTLKFIGEKPDARVQEIEAALKQVEGGAVPIALRGGGFFPTAKSARVFWIGIESPSLAQLAEDVERALLPLGIAREERPYSPHLTLARAPGGSGAPDRRKGDRKNRLFAHLQEKLAASATPDFGSMTAHEFFLYRSDLRRGGALYTKIARFNLQSGD